MRRVLIALTACAVLLPLYSITRPACATSSAPLTHPNSAPASPLIDLQPVLAGLDQPLYVTGAGDGSHRLFVAEKPGRIKVLLPGATDPTVFLDISSHVLTQEEQGLAGLVFHPQFKDNRRFFISYARDPDGATVIAEYHASLADPNLAEPDEQPLLVIPQPSIIHHGGMLAFGADGFLYISTGDGDPLDPGNNAQSLDSLLGKILRIDVDHTDGDNAYSSPASNPFFGATPGRDEIYALGFRNPWRFSIDRETGQLYAGDVGQDQREEIDLVTAGGNFGWHAFEGTLCTGLEPDTCDTLNAIAPMLEYEHTAGRCAVTGGYVYRGTASSLPVGAYVFADFCTGEIFMWNEGTQQLLLDTDLNIDSFGEDDDGEIYAVGFGGTVHRIVNPATEVPPLQITAAQVRKRSSGKVLNPVTVKPNGKKFEVVVQGTRFAAGATLLINGREMLTRAGSSPETELVAQLRGEMLAQPGPLVIEVVNPDETHSNHFTIQIQ